MTLERDLDERGILIVTGSTLRAERADRGIAYQLKQNIDRQLGGDDVCPVVVLGDLWYLNSETLQKLPVISVGGPNVNALAANLYRQLPNCLVVDQLLLIQMDPTLADLRVSIWGAHHDLTSSAVDIFVDRGYLDRFLEASLAHFS